MGIELPPELAQVAQATGAKWPQADEDKMRQQAGAYRDAAGKINTVSGDADAAAHGALTSFRGGAADAARGHWDTFVAPDTGHLPATVQGCHQAADRLDHAADQIGSAKVELVRQLTAAAKNTDAAQHAAAAGFPGALAGVQTTLHGAATNVAAVHSNLTQAVRMDSGVTTRDSVLPVGQSGHGGHPGGLLGGVDDSARGLTGGVGSAAHGLTHGAAGDLTDSSASLAGMGGHTAHTGPISELGATADHAGRGLGTAVGGFGHGVDGVAGGPSGDGSGPGWPVHGGQPDALGSLTGGPHHHTGPINLGGQDFGDSGAAGAALSHGADQGPIGVVGASASPVEPSVAPFGGAAGELGSPGAGPAPGASQGGAGQQAFGGAGYPADGGAAGAGSGGAAGGGLAPGAAPGPGRGGDGGFPGQRPPQAFGGGAPGPATARPGYGPVADGFIAQGGGLGSQHRQPARNGLVAGRADSPVSHDDASGRDDRPAKPSNEAVAFLLYLFPLGHLPVPASSPARQLPVPSAEFFAPSGLRFAPQDHPRADLVDDTAALRAAMAGEQPGQQSLPGTPADHPAVQATSAGYDPLGGAHERDWDRRFLVRPADERSGQRAEYCWPPQELFPEGGCAPEATEAIVLEPGAELDRFGDPDGRVLSDAGAAFAGRSLPPEHRDLGYHRYRVLLPLPAWRTVSAPWFGQHGGAVRYRMTYPVAELLAFGYLDVVELAETGSATAPLAADQPSDDAGLIPAASPAGAADSVRAEAGSPAGSPASAQAGSHQPATARSTPHSTAGEVTT